jgi:hypothetical protein
MLRITARLLGCRSRPPKDGFPEPYRSITVYYDEPLELRVEDAAVYEQLAALPELSRVALDLRARTIAVETSRFHRLSVIALAGVEAASK